MIRQKPLVGESGQLFDHALREAGILRSDVQIANVIRHPIDSVDAYIKARKVKSDTVRELTSLGRGAADDLRVRLSDSQARVFVPMGNLALGALTDKFGITKVRGSPLHPGQGYSPHSWVIPTVHPAYCLPFRGNEHWIDIIIRDLKKIKSFAAGEAEVIDRNLLINPTYSEVGDYLEECDKHGRVAFDIETFNNHVSCMSFSYDKRHAISIPFLAAPWSPFQECIIWRRIAKVLENPNVEKVGSFIASFDIPFLFYLYKIITRGRIIDSAVAHRIMYPDYPATLEFLCSIYTNQEYYKDDKKAWKRPLENPDRFYRYNALDSCVVLEIVEDGGEFMTELKDDYWITYQNVMTPFEAALFAGMRGMKIDKAALEKSYIDIKSKLVETEAEFGATAEYDFNPGSGPACMKYFYIHKKLKPYMKRVKKGNKVEYRQTCDDKALARLARKGYKEAKLIQEIRNLRKLRDSYYEIGFDVDGRMRCSYDLKGTKSARLSSRKTPWGTGGNQQNLDPRFKSFIVPD